MDQRLANAYAKVLSKHYAAVQTDTALSYNDSWKLEQKAKKFWADFEEAGKEFRTLLDRCVLP